jgi:ABC-2 type transport system ATP-binding protein
MNAVEVESLVKRYDDVVALDEISLEIKAGEIFGILGPNGAGKTTLIEIIEGLRVADGGRISVLGRDPEHDGAHLRNHVSIAMQKTALPPRVTVREIVSLYASIYGCPERSGDAIAKAGLSEKAGAKLHTLSGGQLQRLTVVLATIGPSDLVLMDEPTSELDPQGRRYVWDVIREKLAADPGVTVLLTTHMMDEAQRLCDRVAIIDHGRIVALGTPHELIAQYAPEKIVTLNQTNGRALSSIAGLSAVSQATDIGRQTILRTSNLPATLRQIAELEFSHELRYDGMNVTDSTLEDVFLTLTGREVRK